MTDFEYVCSERLITATIGGTRGIASVSFRPDRVTKIPKKVFQALCERKAPQRIILESKLNPRCWIISTAGCSGL